MAQEIALHDPRCNKSLLGENNTVAGETKRLQTNNDGSLLVDIAADSSVASAIDTGNKDVATAGVAVKLTASATPCKRLIITGKAANTNKIYIGGTSVASTDGTFIYASQTLQLEIDDVSKVYIDADTSSEGVQFTYVT